MCCKADIFYIFVFESGMNFIARHPFLPDIYAFVDIIKLISLTHDLYCVKYMILLFSLFMFLDFC